MGITVLLHGYQEGSANMWPGGTEKVVASGNGVVAARQLAQRHHATERSIDVQTMAVSSEIRYYRPALLPL